jgi:hypothetical protein
MLSFALTVPPFHLDSVFRATFSYDNVANALITLGLVRFTGFVLIPFPSELSAMAAMPASPCPNHGCEKNSYNSKSASLLGQVPDFNGLLRHLPPSYTGGVLQVGGGDCQRSCRPCAFVSKIDSGQCSLLPPSLKPDLGVFSSSSGRLVHTDPASTPLRNTTVAINPHTTASSRHTPLFQRVLLSPASPHPTPQRQNPKPITTLASVFVA